MPLKRESLERQLRAAQEVLDGVKKQLLDKGVAEADLKKQPAYRDAHGDLRTVKRRLEVVADKESLAAAAAVASEEE